MFERSPSHAWPPAVAISRLFSQATLAVAALAGSFSAGAASEAAYQAAFRNFLAASSGDSSSIEQATDATAALIKAQAGDPVLTAYAGAITTMRAGTTLLPMKKMGYAEDGLALIDKSLALLTPESDAASQHGTPPALEVKFVAASTFLAVPGFMNRGARGAKLLNEVLASPLFGATPLAFKGSVWMRAATLAIQEKRTVDARRYLNEVIAQGAPQAEAAKAKLKDAV